MADKIEWYKIISGPRGGIGMGVLIYDKDDEGGIITWTDLHHSNENQIGEHYKNKVEMSVDAGSFKNAEVSKEEAAEILQHLPAILKILHEKGYRGIIWP